MATGSRISGLKMFRKNQSDKKPKYPCDNCKCVRYSPCTCKRRSK